MTVRRAPARIADAAGAGAGHDETASLPSPAAVRGLLEGSATGFVEELNGPAEPVTLGPWDVRLLRSEADAGS